MAKRVIYGPVKLNGTSITNRSIYDFQGPISDVINNLTQMKSEAESNGYSNITVHWNSGYSSDDIEWSLTGERLETDKEEAKRLEIEKRIKENAKKEKQDRLERERKEYERLKKKFEK